MNRSALRVALAVVGLWGLLGLSACRTTVDPLTQAREIGPGLVLDCGPDEAEVAVDGVLQGTCEDLKGHVIPLKNKAQRVEVSRPGFRPYGIELSPGAARTKLKIELAPSN